MLAADLYALWQNFWLTCRRALVPSKQKTCNLPLPKNTRVLGLYTLFPNVFIEYK